MAGTDVLKGASLLAQELVNCLHLPGAVLLDKALTQALEKRHAEGVTLLIEELSQHGKEDLVIGEEDYDTFVQMLLRFGSALHSGAAKRNLRLIARLIVGLHADGSFHYDEFSRFTTALENISLVEMQTLVALHRVYQQNADAHAAWKVFLAGRDFGSVEGRDLLGVLGSLTRTGFVAFLSGFDVGQFVPTSDCERVMILAQELATPE